MTETERKTAAKKFAADWKDRGYEKGESQPFWLSLRRDVLGVEHPEDVIQLESKVMIDHTSFIDGYIALTHTLRIYAAGEILTKWESSRFFLAPKWH